MKKLFTFLCIFLIAGCHAQSVSNSALIASYEGYANGKHQVQLKTTQSCGTEIRFRFSSGTPDLIVNMTGDAQQTVFLDDPAHKYSSVDIKTSTNCSGGTNATWITLQLQTALALKVLDFSAREHAGGVLLLFRLELTGGDYVEIERASEDGIWKRLATIRTSSVHSTLDMTTTPGRNFYRLKLHEAAHVSYTPVTVVRLQESEPLKATLYNINGVRMGEVNKALLKSELRAFPRGIYVLYAIDHTQKIYND